MTRKIKHYDSLSPIWRKQILNDLKYNVLNLLDVAINQSQKKAVLVNSQDEEWLVILNFSPEVEEENDDYFNDDYSDDEESTTSFEDGFDEEDE